MDHSKNKKKPGFDLPNDYFEQLETNIELAEMEAILPETTGFSIPSDYFEKFEDVLLNTIHENSTESKVIPLHRKTWFQLTIGIAACLLIGLFILNPSNPSASTSFEELDIAAYEVADYFENNTTINTDDVADLLTDEEIEEITLENDILSTVNVEDYLLDNLDDTSLLIE